VQISVPLKPYPALGTPLLALPGIWGANVNGSHCFGPFQVTLPSSPPAETVIKTDHHILSNEAGE